MRRIALLACALGMLAPHRAWAKKADKGDDDEESASDDSDDSSKDEDEKPAKKKAAPKKEEKAAPEEAEDDKPETVKTQGVELQKQDLSGHALGTGKKITSFERDRFFVDKVDDEKTENGTLIQGALTSSTLLYTESGGPYASGGMTSTDGAKYSRLFTDLRLQTDFRHISGSRWDARFDGRLRFVADPDNTKFAVATGPATTPVTATHIQSGLTGENEYEIRELWLVRNGKRSDVFLGRQFIPDLGAIKIDGIRVDYASSEKLTWIGFGGLYPFRGSRSITTDYIGLKNTDGTPSGKFVTAGGFGGAWRTTNTYGSFGGVALYPLQNERPRIYGTQSGYFRNGSKIDFYDFVLIDLFGAAGFQFTNVSAGLNYKPVQRLRVTANVNRTDTETLNIQAGAFLGLQDKGTGSVVQNETFISRLATQAARGGISAGLGNLERFEVSTAITYRQRPDFSLTSVDGTMTFKVPAASSVEVWGGITDRRSIANLRLGIDALRTFKVGDTAYQRSDLSSVRVSAAREFKEGQGEWEAEVAYTGVADSNTGIDCGMIANCFGASNSTLLSLGGQVFYRFNRDWFGMASAYLSRIDNKRTGLTMTDPAITDPTITGLTGFLRAATRF